MTRGKSYRITAFWMAILIFLSSTGFSIDMHYCQGELKSFSLFGEAKSCHDEVQESHCKLKKTSCKAASISTDGKCEKDCCSNKTITTSIFEEGKTAEIKPLTKAQSDFLAAFISVYLLSQYDHTSFIVPHLNYIHPLLNRDIPVLIQSFLL